MENNKLGAVISKIHQAVEDNWIVSLFLVKLSGVWFSLVLAFFGNGWLTENSEKGRYLTALGWILTVVVLLLNLGMSMIDRYCEIHTKDKEELVKITAERDLLVEVNSSVDTICKNKLHTQLHEIENVMRCGQLAPLIYTNPCRQIQNILDELSRSISFLISDKTHRFDKSEIHTNLICNFPFSDRSTWYNIDEYSASVSNVITNKKSTFVYLLDAERPYVFFNDKQEAFGKGHYYPTDLDEVDGNGNLKGSIGFFLLTFRNSSGEYIKAVLTIATYKRHIVDENELLKTLGKKVDTQKVIKDACDTLAYNINSSLVDNYRNRIGIELCNYYMQRLSANG